MIQFGENVEGYNIHVLNEREIRAAAGILFLLMFVAILTVVLKNDFLLLKYAIIIFLTDMLIRVFINPRLSPSLILGRLVVRNQTPEYVGAEQEKFSKLLRFNSSSLKDSTETISLDQYVEKMIKDQKDIYYAVGSSREAVALDPHLEIFKNKGIEVLYLYDPMDEFVMDAVKKYKDFELKSVEQADVKNLNKMDSVDEDVKEVVEELSKSDKNHFSSLMKKMKEILGDKVQEVKESDRLSGSPIVLVNPADGMTSTMQKIMNMSGRTVNAPQKIMEVNKDHKLIRNLIKVFKSNDKDEYITTVVEQLYESSLSLEGFLNDPHKLVDRVNSLLEDSSDWYTNIRDLK